MSDSAQSVVGPAAVAQAEGAPPAPGETAAVPGRRPFLSRTFWSLRNRDYRLLWASSLFSSAGLWIQQTSVGWLTYDLTGSAFLLGIVNGFRSIPLLFLAPFGGVAADRVDRRKLMLVTQLFLMGVTAAFATAVLLGYARVWNIVLFTLLTGVAWAFNMPVRQSIIPNLVTKDQLQNAVALSTAGMNLTRIVGPSVAGLLIAVVGITGNFYLQAAMYVGVSAMVWQLSVPPVKSATRDVSVMRNLSDGAKYVWREKQLRLQMAVALLPILLATPYSSLMPVFAKDVLGVGPAGFGLLMAAPGVGALIGVLGVASADNVRRRGLLIFICLICLGLALVGFALSRWFAVSMVLLMFVGAFQMIYMSMNRTLLQLHTPDEYRGRVMGIYMLNQGLQPLGALLAGTIAQFSGAPWATGSMGVAVALIAVFALLGARRLREA